MSVSAFPRRARGGSFMKQSKPKCAYCTKPIKFPAYSLKLDLDLPTLYFCTKIEAELWLTNMLYKIDK